MDMQRPIQVGVCGVKGSLAPPISFVKTKRVNNGEQSERGIKKRT